MGVGKKAIGILEETALDRRRQKKEKVASDDEDEDFEAQDE